MGALKSKMARPPPKNTAGLDNDPFLSHAGAAQRKDQTLKLDGGHHYQETFDEAEELALARSPAVIQFLSIWLPLIFFTVLLSFFTFGYHRFPIMPWVIAVIGIDIALVGAWPPRKETGHSPWDYLPVLALLLGVVCGSFFGWINSANMEPWVHATYLREYNDVMPDKSPAEYSDAGIIHFAPGSTLDLQRAAGFKAWPHMYCAAPVVPPLSGTGSEPTVGFWAVGINCCDGREKFWCDGAKDAGARSGLRMEGSSVAKLQGHEPEWFFDMAVKKAAATEGLIPSDNLMFVSWGKDPRAVAESWWWVAFGTYIILLCSALGTASVMSLLLKWHLAMVKSPI